MADLQAPRGGRPRSSSRLSEDVARAIQKDLIDQRLPPGSKLPTEPELAARFDVGRSVIREAGRILSQLGLVDIRPGRGMTVAELDGSGIAEQYALLIKLNPEAFDQLMQMRMVIETAVTAAAASARTADDLAALRASIEATRQASEDENYQAAIDADLTFHSAVARATQNPFLVLVMNPVNEALRETYREPQGYLASQPETAAEHEAIYEAILSQDPEAAGEAAQTHIRRVIAGRDRFLGE